MKQIKELIEQGQGDAALERFAAMLSDFPDKADAAVDLLLQILQDCNENGHDSAVARFLNHVDARLPSAVAVRVREGFAVRISGRREWADVLRDLTRERLGREMRRDVVLKKVNEAADNCARLLQRARNEQELDQNALLLARALAELHRDRERALHVIQAIPVRGDRQLKQGVELLRQHYARLARSLVEREFETRSDQWRRQLIEAVLALAVELPGINELGEPDEQQQQHFLDEVKTILRAGLANRDMDDMIDALEVLVEFCPIDEAAIKSAAGVEERMFIQLGPRARLTAVRTMRQVGQLETIRKAVLALAQSDESKGRLKLLSGIMGGLGHPDFYPWLSRQMGKIRTKLEESWLVDALSRLSHPDAARLLTERLHRVVRKIGERDNLARAQELLIALGRVSRSRGVDAGQRDAIVRRVVEAVEGADRSVRAMAAEKLFSNRPGGLSRELRAWAVAQCVDAMWGQPLKDSVQTLAAANSWRQPMVTTLSRLGEEMLPELLAAADKYKTMYCGAMGAMANVLEAAGNEQAVPLLETMILCALNHDEEGQRSHLFDEKKLDSGTGAIGALDRDEIVHSMLYTLLEVGGAAGEAVTLDLADQVQAGRILSPGERTTRLLFDTKLRHGAVHSVSRRAEVVTLNPKEFKHALGAARGGLFSKKGQRIAAMASLGQTRSPEAVGVLLDGLGDKDPMISSAAHTAMAQYMHPLPTEEEFAQFWDEVFDRQKAIKGPMAERLQAFIQREMPKNPPYDNLFKRQVSVHIEDAELIHRMLASLNVPQPKGARREPEPQEELHLVTPEEGGGPLVNTGVAAGSKMAGAVSDLEKKRAYFEARRQWISSGKKGAPPEPPA